MARLSRATFLGAVLLAGAALAQGQIIIINGDPPGQGFNDPTPAVPIGGNTGTTLGAQRLQVFETAASIWEATLHPKLDIRVLATFEPLGTNVLGSAGTTFIHADFPGAELPGTWYHAALANQLSGRDLAREEVLAETGVDDPNVPHIRARFTTQFPFYFGLDNNELPGTTDLLVVLLHEIGHGLGFANFANEQTGALTLDLPDVYSQYTLDVTTGKVWNQMTNAERAASALRVGFVSWSGVNTAKDTPKVLQIGDPTVIITSPSGLGPYVAGTASFGPALTAAGSSGQIVQAVDPANPNGPRTTDACNPLSNAAAVAGKIAFLDRGTCAFTQKVTNAQNAGAIAVIVADNAAGDPPAGLGGTDPNIKIPSVRVSITVGNAIKAALASGPVTGVVKLDTSRRAGTDSVLGLMRLAALNPVALGSSISHVDSTAFPNQL
ncbi:MAG TPA: PA domain-containing protein, partial [Myxococcaceae bacterium]